LAAFNYQALDQKGNKQKGTIASDSIDSVRRELKSNNLSPVKIKSVSDSSILNLIRPNRISSKGLVKFTRQLAALLKGGLPLENSLTSIGQESKREVEKEQILSISLLIQQGKSFSDSLKEYPQTFDPLFIALISAGESSGELSISLNRLSLYLERKEKIKNEVIGALVYPLVLVVVAFIIVSLLLVFVVPNVVNQFSGLNQELPLLTKILINTSNFFSSFYFFSFLTLILLISLYIRTYFRDGFSKIKDRFLISIPFLKEFLVQADISRFLNAMSLLRKGGMTIVESINISLKTISNSHLKGELSSSLRSVSEGSSLTNSLKKVNLIPPFVIQMISSGERGGELEEVLSKTSDFLDEEFQQSSKLMISLLEPLIVVIMGGIVATIIIAILLPLIQMNNLSLIN